MSNIKNIEELRIEMYPEEYVDIVHELKNDYMNKLCEKIIDSTISYREGGKVTGIVVNKVLLIDDNGNLLKDCGYLGTIKLSFKQKSS